MKENKIRDSLDKIEPGIGAKERMYQDILKKAEEKKQAKPLVQDTAPKKERSKVISLRFVKTFAPIAACLCITILGVIHFWPLGDLGTDPPTNPPVLGNPPYIEVESPEVFEQIGITLDAPEKAENECYAVLDGNIASIDFEIGDHSYFIVASVQSGDFSGLSGDVLSSEQLDSKSSAVLYEIESEPTNIYKASWTDGKIHYYFGNSDGADKEDFKSICMELIRQTIK